MRMIDNDARRQVFRVCIFLTPGEVQDLMGLFEWCLEEEPGASHAHLHEDQDPDKPWKSREPRGITGLLYERINPQEHGWKSDYIKLIEDDAGKMETVDYG